MSQNKLPTIRVRTFISRAIACINIRQQKYPYKNKPLPVFAPVRHEIHSLLVWFPMRLEAIKVIFLSLSKADSIFYISTSWLQK